MSNDARRKMAHRKAKRSKKKKKTVVANEINSGATKHIPALGIAAQGPTYVFLELGQTRRGLTLGQVSTATGGKTHTALERLLYLRGDRP